MEEIVLRVRRRHGASRVQLECEYRIDGRIVEERTPRRFALPFGVSRLTFEHAADLASHLEHVTAELTTPPVLF